MKNCIIALTGLFLFLLINTSFMLRKGNTGPHVAFLQEMFQQIGYDIVADGYFGPKTEEVVIEFQKDYNLQPDGIVGNMTYNKLNELLNQTTVTLHESILALGTEGLPYGDTNLDVRYPHWPGYQSGVSIGIGFDIGATRITAEQLKNFFSTLGVPDTMIKELQKTVFELGADAKYSLDSLKLREKVRLTMQQAFDILIVVKNSTGLYVRKGFPTSYHKLHPAIIEAFNKISYGAPALITGWRSQNFAGFGPMYDKKLAAAKTHIEQCDVFLDAMRAMKEHPWPADSVRDIHGTRISRGMHYFISKVKSILVAGGEVHIKHGTLAISDLMSIENKTLDWAAEVSQATHGSRVTGQMHRNGLLKARQSEPKSLYELCMKVGCTMPDIYQMLDWDRLNYCFKIFNPGKDILLMYAQKHLLDNGYFPSGGIENADGLFGTKTSAALKKYQETNKLPVTGQFDENTRSHFTTQIFV